jgi:hypothetical protein
MELQFLEVAAGLHCVLEIQSTIGENPPLAPLGKLGYKVVAKGFAPNPKVKEGRAGRRGEGLATSTVTESATNMFSLLCYFLPLQCNCVWCVWCNKRLKVP